MAMKRHCDICGAEALNPEAHVWANQLPANSRLRTVAATISFSDAGTNRHHAPLDLCETCFGTWVRGLAAAKPPAEPLSNVLVAIDEYLDGVCGHVPPHVAPDDECYVCKARELVRVALEARVRGEAK